MGRQAQPILIFTVKDLTVARLALSAGGLQDSDLQLIANRRGRQRMTSIVVQDHFNEYH